MTAPRSRGRGGGDRSGGTRRRRGWRTSGSRAGPRRSVASAAIWGNSSSRLTRSRSSAASGAAGSARCLRPPAFRNTRRSAHGRTARSRPGSSRSARGQVDVDLDCLVGAAVDQVPAGRVDADLVHELVEEDDVAAPLRHLRLLAAASQVDELVQQDLDPLGVVAERAGDGRVPVAGAVVVGAEHVDSRSKPRSSLSEVHDVGGPVRRLPRSERSRTRSCSSPYADERAQSAPSRSYVSDLGSSSGSRSSRRLCSTQSRSGSGTAPGGLHPLEHRGYRIARELGQLTHVLAPVAVLRRLLPAPHRLDRRPEEFHLRAGVVVVVLPLDVVPGEVNSRASESPNAPFRAAETTIGPVGLAETISTWTRSRRSAEPAPKPEPASRISAERLSEPARQQERLRKPGPATSARSTTGRAAPRRRAPPRARAAACASGARPRARVGRVVAVLGIGWPLQLDAAAEPSASSACSEPATP